MSSSQSGRIPVDLRGAGKALRIGFRYARGRGSRFWSEGLSFHNDARLCDLPKDAFLSIWNAVAYLYPGLHPDDWGSEGSGWPRALDPFAREAWRRAEAGELEDDEIYPCDAQRARLEAAGESEAS